MASFGGCWRVAFLLAVLAPAANTAGDAALDRATLRGLKAVGIVIDKVDPELVHQGLSEETLRARIEKRLTDGGITVDRAANEFVALRVIHVRNGRGPYALCIAVGLYQPVILSRNKDARTATQTWEVETVLMSDSRQLQEASLTSVDELADRFVAAYRSVNPSLAQGPG
jgi:hypothetical protein